MSVSSFKQLRKRVPINAAAVIFVCGFVGVGAIASFAIPWFAKLILDGNNSKEYLMILAGTVAGATILSVIGRYIFNKISIS